LGAVGDRAGVLQESLSLNAAPESQLIARIRQPLHDWYLTVRQTLHLGYALQVHLELIERIACSFAR
jgi:hypothetical protein